MNNFNYIINKVLHYKVNIIIKIRIHNAPSVVSPFVNSTT